MKRRKKKLPQGINFHLTLITFSLLFKDKCCYITCLGRTRDRLTRKRKYNTIREENTGKVFTLSLYPLIDIYQHFICYLVAPFMYAPIIVLAVNIKIDFSTCFQSILILLLFSAGHFLPFPPKAINNRS